MFHRHTINKIEESYVTDVSVRCVGTFLDISEIPSTICACTVILQSHSRARGSDVASDDIDGSLHFGCSN